MVENPCMATPARFCYENQAHVPPGVRYTNEQNAALDEPLQAMGQPFLAASRA